MSFCKTGMPNCKDINQFCKRRSNWKLYPESIKNSECYSKRSFLQFAYILCLFLRLILGERCFSRNMFMLVFWLFLTLVYHYHEQLDVFSWLKTQYPYAFFHAYSMYHMEFKFLRIQTLKDVICLELSYLRYIFNFFSKSPNEINKLVPAHHSELKFNCLRIFSSKRTHMKVCVIILECAKNGWCTQNPPIMLLELLHSRLRPFLLFSSGMLAIFCFLILLQCLCRHGYLSAAIWRDCILMFCEHRLGIRQSWEVMLTCATPLPKNIQNSE